MILKFLHYRNINNYFDKKINIVIMVDKLKEVNTKNNEKMCFITGSDEVDSIDIVLFPDVYKQSNIKIGDIVKINGKVEKRFDKYQIIANTIENLTI